MFASLAIPPAWRPALDRLGQTAPRLAEALLVYALALAVGQVAFMDGFGALLWPLNNAYWMFLFVAWAGVRLGLGGTTVLLGLVALQAGWGTLQGRGFFAQDLHSAGLGYASYMAILALVGWSLAGYLAALERRKADARIAAIAFECQEGMLITDAQGRILRANRSFQHLAATARKRCWGGFRPFCWRTAARRPSPCRGPRSSARSGTDASRASATPCGSRAHPSPARAAGSRTTCSP